MLKHEYESEYSQARDDPNAYWSSRAHSLLSWYSPFSRACPPTLSPGTLPHDRWFTDGTLNACYNCVDRWATSTPHHTAFIFLDNSGNSTAVTYLQLLHRVEEVSRWLLPTTPDDVVTIFMPTVPNAIYTMLACARLGIPHNVVFSGFSSSSLRLRLIHSKSTRLVIQPHSFRGTKFLDFLSLSLEALAGNLDIQLMLFDTPQPHPDLLPVLSSLRVSFWSLRHPDSSPVPPSPLPSNHPLFFLYTSGSTGTPKCVVHSTGGYLLYVASSLSLAFAIRSGDVFFCTADIGWITAHSYSVYGPLALGITSVMMEGLPNYPDPLRLFSVVRQFGVTHLYTAPTVVRILREYLSGYLSGDDDTRDGTSLRLLGCVGEPLGASTHSFYSRAFGNLPVIDTYFQTETAGILIAPIPGVVDPLPESVGIPLPGIVVSLNSDSLLHVEQSWPGMAIGILNDEVRFREYFKDEGYRTGDEGIREGERIRIKGRADDVINVAGHRISTAEVESAAMGDEVVEVAAVGVKHKIKGEGLVLFAVLREKRGENEEERIKERVGNKIGRFSVPDRVVVCRGVPKTATGKIMRRVLKDIVEGKEVGDISTCINREIVNEIAKQI